MAKGDEGAFRDLEEAIRFYLDAGFRVLFKDMNTAQLVRAKRFSLLGLLLTGIVPYFAYWLWKRDDEVYLESHADKIVARERLWNSAVGWRLAVALYAVYLFFIVARAAAV